MFYVCPDKISIVCFFLKKLIDRPYYIVLRYPLNLTKDNAQCDIIIRHQNKVSVYFLFISMEHFVKSH